MHTESTNGLTKDTPSFFTVDKWVPKFNCDRISVNMFPKKSHLNSRTHINVIDHMCKC